MNIPKKISEYRKGVLSLIILSLIFASMGLFAQYLSTGFELFQQVYLRIFAEFMLSFIVFEMTLISESFKKLAQKNGD